MGWEQRGARIYYYHKVRAGGQVRSTYMGHGVVGQICAKNDRQKQLDRMTKRVAHRVTRKAEEEIDSQLVVAESAITNITAAVLYAGGYHKHKGQWRKKRHEKKAPADEDT